MDQNTKEYLAEKARGIRLGIIEAVHAAKSGHPGGSLSIADILSYLYFREMNVNSADPKMDGRDRLVLSKGHAAPALYSVLAEAGYFPKEDLLGLRKPESYLQGHPDMKHTPGVEMSTGSLGQGISAACGMALAHKLDKKDSRIYVILGDGETEEGQVWEAMMFAAHYKLANLCAVIDWNGLQIDGPIAEVMNPAPYAEKLSAFGWNTVEADAHDFDSLEAAFGAAKACKDKPTAIIAKSTKGKGVSFMENNVSWHGAAPNDEQFAQAMEELGGNN